MSVPGIDGADRVRPARVLVGAVLPAASGASARAGVPRRSAPASAAVAL